MPLPVPPRSGAAGSGADRSEPGACGSHGIPEGWPESTSNSGLLADGRQSGRAVRSGLGRLGCEAHRELPQLLGSAPVPSHLVHALVELDRDYTAEPHDERWEDWYAERLLAQFGAKPS